jgi:L-fuculokinase
VTCLVFDFGKTLIKQRLVRDDGSVAKAASAPARWTSTAPYPHCDVASTWQWMLDRMSELPEREAIESVVCVAHGATVALLGEEGLVLPILDYEAPIPDAIRGAYEKQLPPFREVFAPLMSCGLNIGLQLYWLESTYPSEFARLRHIVGFAQYWVWKLTGVISCDFSSVGAHSHLWNPERGIFSSLADRRGWNDFIPPLCHSYERVGALERQVAAATGLPAQCIVLAGGHDSAVASYFYTYQGFSSFSLVSAGTWVVLANTHASLDLLESTAGAFVCVTPDATPLATLMFMGGRELEFLAGGEVCSIEQGDIERVIADGVMALPSFAAGGYVAGTGGQVVGVMPRDARQKTALGTLYVCLMTDLGLDLLASENDIVVDGGLSRSDVLLDVLAALRPNQVVHANRASDGTATGAACLSFRATGRKRAPNAIRRIERRQILGLTAYAARWRAFTRANGGGAGTPRAGYFH